MKRNELVVLSGPVPRLREGKRPWARSIMVRLRVLIQNFCGRLCPLCDQTHGGRVKSIIQSRSDVLKKRASASYWRVTTHASTRPISSNTARAVS